MKKTITIEWGKPEDKDWLTEASIAKALEKHLDTRFVITTIGSLPPPPLPDTTYMIMDWKGIFWHPSEHVGLSLEEVKKIWPEYKKNCKEGHCRVHATYAEFQTHEIDMSMEI